MAAVGWFLSAVTGLVVWMYVSYVLLNCGNHCDGETLTLLTYGFAAAAGLGAVGAIRLVSRSSGLRSLVLSVALLFTASTERT